MNQDEDVVMEAIYRELRKTAVCATVLICILMVLMVALPILLSLLFV